MIHRAHRQTASLVFALGLSFAATAEEQKPASTPAPAPKVATAVVKPAVPVTEAKPAATETAAKPEAAAKPSPAATPPATAKPAVAVIAPKQPEIPVPQRVPPRPHKKPAPQRIALASTAVAATPAAAPVPHALHWSYEGATGPQAWAKLAPEYAKCGNGERQSPIDIRDGMKLDLEPLVFEYRPSSFKVVDNGHAIQANVNGWNTLRVMGRRFRLIQFHFHRPSEEVIDGRQFEMVVHLVHKDGEGRLAVVAVLVDGGARQPAIQTVLNNLPLEKGEEAAAATNLDLAQILPENRRYFTYMGSLTTPPCTEDVLWIVMKQPLQASADQLDMFSRLYPMNARPIQAASGRTIKESN